MILLLNWLSVSANKMYGTCHYVLEQKPLPLSHYNVVMCLLQTGKRKGVRFEGCRTKADRRAGENKRTRRRREKGIG